MGQLRLKLTKFVQSVADLGELAMIHGAFRVEGLAPGSWTVDARASGMTTKANRTVTAPPGSTPVTTPSPKLS